MRNAVLLAGRPLLELGLGNVGLALGSLQVSLLPLALECADRGEGSHSGLVNGAE